MRKEVRVPVDNNNRTIPPLKYTEEGMLMTCQGIDYKTNEWVYYYFVSDAVIQAEEVKFGRFTIYENGVAKKITYDDLVEYTKQGYKVEMKLIKPAIIMDMSIDFELN